jgi:hypothetical protein
VQLNEKKFEILNFFRRISKKMDFLHNVETYRSSELASSVLEISWGAGEERDLSVHGEFVPSRERSAGNAPFRSRNLVANPVQSVLPSNTQPEM